MAKAIETVIILFFMSLIMASTFPSIWDEPILWDVHTAARSLFFFALFIGLNTALIKD